MGGQFASAKLGTCVCLVPSLLCLNSAAVPQSLCCAASGCVFARLAQDCICWLTVIMLLAASCLLVAENAVDCRVWRSGSCSLEQQCCLLSASPCCGPSTTPSPLTSSCTLLSLAGYAIIPFLMACICQVFATCLEIKLYCGNSFGGLLSPSQVKAECSQKWTKLLCKCDSLLFL